MVCDLRPRIGVRPFTDCLAISSPAYQLVEPRLRDSAQLDHDVVDLGDEGRDDKTLLDALRLEFPALERLDGSSVNSKARCVHTGRASGSAYAGGGHTVELHSIEGGLRRRLAMGAAWLRLEQRGRGRENGRRVVEIHVGTGSGRRLPSRSWSCWLTFVLFVCESPRSPCWVGRAPPCPPTWRRDSAAHREGRRNVLGPNIFSRIPTSSSCGGRRMRLLGRVTSTLPPPRAQPFAPSGDGRDGPMKAKSALWSIRRALVSEPRLGSRTARGLGKSDPRSRIALIDSLGRDLQVITPGDDVSLYGWSTDGVSVIARDYGGFRSLPVAGGPSKPLRIAGSRHLGVVDWSPDETRIAANVEARHRDHECRR